MALKIQDVLNMIEDAVKLKGAAVGLARKWGVSTAYLSDVRRRRRAPGNAILTNLGLYAETTYYREKK